MSYIYHRVPEGLQGDTLYPLDILKDKYPAIYTAAFAKYADRPTLPTKRVYPLDCLWNDVLFFLPINPAKHVEFIRTLGYGKIKNSYFEVPAERVLPSSTCIYLSKTKTCEPEDFCDYDPCTIDQYNYLPQQNQDYLRELLGRREKNFFPWNHAPQVLYKGELNVSGLRILSVGGDCPPEGVYTNFNSATP